MPASSQPSTLQGVVAVDRTGRPNADDVTAPFYFYGPVRRLADGSRVQTKLRGSAMMNYRCIKAAFGMGKMEMKFAMPKADIVPYNCQSLPGIEPLVAMATIATIGQLDLVTFEPVEHLWWIVGQAFAVGLPEEMFHSPETSNAFIMKGAIKYLKSFDASRRDEISKRVPSDEKWYIVGREDEMPVTGVRVIVEVLAAHMNPNDRILMMNSYVGVFLSYSKQGQVTAAKLRKVLDGTNDGTILLTVTVEQVRTLWDKFGPYFDEVSARSFFPKAERWFRGLNLHTTLTIMRTVHPGLSCLALAKDAMAGHPGFQWEQLASAFPAAFAAFQAAIVEVGNDPYYGYRKDLKGVAVANYIPIAYAAIQIQKEVDGDTNIGALLSLTKSSIPNKPFIDQLIDNYKKHRTTPGVQMREQ